MSGIRNQGVHRAADFPKQPLTVAIITAVSLTDAVVYSFTPGFPFIIERVRSFCRAKAGAVTYQVKVGSRIAVATANGVFTAATEVGATLSTTFANKKGSKTEAITIEITTDGTGALTNGHVSIYIRPWPLNGDLGPR